MKNSKPLGIADESGFLFAQEMLAGDKTAGINFDRLQHHPEKGYIIFEYLLCAETQKVDPWTSHPRRYWDKNKQKFISLKKVADDLKAKLYLINYAKKGTEHENKIKIIEVIKIDNKKGIIEEKVRDCSREEFQQWFRKLNKECLK